MKAVAFAAVTSLVLLFVWERVDIVRIGYHIERLKAQKVLLERERDELRVKLSGLTAPERIARLASDKLGMMQPEKGQVVVINDSYLKLLVENEFGVGQSVVQGFMNATNASISLSVRKKPLPYVARDAEWRLRSTPGTTSTA